MTDLAVRARQIVDANRYMTLGTADADGTPWATPVWFAAVDYREFLWVSRPGARHSENLAARPEVGIVIFDSTVVPGDAVAVYIEAAAEVEAAEVERHLALFSAESVRQDLPIWALDDVVAPAEFRLYRATASEWFLGDGGKRFRIEA